VKEFGAILRPPTVRWRKAKGAHRKRPLLLVLLHGRGADEDDLSHGSIYDRRWSAGARNVTAQDDVGGGSRGMGFGWAPDPRVPFRSIGAYDTTYTDCEAVNCEVGFDTWFHVNSTWTRPTFTNCPTEILVEPGGTRTLSGDPCSECDPPITVTLKNIESGNTYPL